jgi:hypothetical protein
MRRPMLGLTMRQAALIRYTVVVALAVDLLVKLLSSANLGPVLADRRGEELAVAEIDRLVSVPVMIVTEGGSETFMGITIDAAPPLGRSLWIYLPLLEAELNVYSAGMIEKSGLRRVVLCSGLAYNGQKVSGIPDLDRGTLYLEAIDNPAPRDFARGAIHHELFHMIDFHDGRLLQSDPRWEGLNDKGTRYGDGGHRLLGDPTALLPDDSVAGFLNAYSRSAIEEDKAEVFAHMMVRPDVLEARMAKDAILVAKCQEMRRRLKTYCPEMDEAFWARARDRGR